jgi:hypothetical protein
VLDHLQSSAPGLLLLPRSSSLPAVPHLSPAYHKTSKHDSPHKIDSRVEPPKTSRIQIQTEASQLRITYQTKVLITWFLKCAADKDIEESIFVDEELQGFDGDEDELLLPSISSPELVPTSTLEAEAPQAVQLIRI